MKKAKVAKKDLTKREGPESQNEEEEDQSDEVVVEEIEVGKIDAFGNRRAEKSGDEGDELDN